MDIHFKTGRLSLIIKYLLFLKNIILIVLVSLGYCSMAQGGFKQSFVIPGADFAKCREVIETPAGNFILLGVHHMPGDTFSYLTLICTDAQGNFLWRKSYGSGTCRFNDSPFAVKGAVFQTTNFFYHAGVLLGTGNKGYGSLIKFNYNGDTLWQKIFVETSPKDLIFQGLNGTIDNALFITGASQNWGSDGGGQPSLLIKVNMDGNELWRRRINKPIKNISDLKSAVQDPVSKKIIGVGYQYIGSNSNFSTYPHVLICDSMGFEISRFSFANAESGGFAEVVQLADGNFLSGNSWHHHTKGISTYNYTYIVKFDINGNIIWSKKYDYVSPVNIVRHFYELPSGDIMVAGRIQDTIDIYAVIKPHVFCIDKDGNLKWNKAVGSAYIDIDSTYLYGEETFQGFNHTQDGGFVLASQMYPYKAFRMIKIDANACDTTEAVCATREVQVPVNNKSDVLNIFPVPSPGELIIELGNDSTPCELRVFSLSGQLVMTSAIRTKNSILDLHHVEAGVYYLTLSRNAEMLAQKKLVIFK